MEFLHMFMEQCLAKLPGIDIISHIYVLVLHCNKASCHIQAKRI